MDDLEQPGEDERQSFGGIRHCWNVIGGDIGAEVLRRLREEFAAVAEAADWSFTAIARKGESRRSEEGRKLLIAGCVSPSARGFMRGMSLKEPLSYYLALLLGASPLSGPTAQR